MAFVLIKGTFHVKGYSPDGDSIRFRAKNSDNWKKLSGPAVELNARGHAQLRIEAVDALETHYQGYHQPLKLAKAAGRYLLSYLGIHEVVWDESQTRVIKAEDGTEGYILARSTEANRRPVAFVFAGGIEERDGSLINLDESILKKSLNYGLIARGLAYPTYYNGLFSDLRLPLTRAMAHARAEGKGIWPYDVTTKGFSCTRPKADHRRSGHPSQALPPPCRLHGRWRDDEWLQGPSHGKMRASGQSSSRSTSQGWMPWWRSKEIR